MKKLKGLLAVIVTTALAPEFRPTEIRIVRAVVAAVLAYLGVKFGVQEA